MRALGAWTSHTPTRNSLPPMIATIARKEFTELLRDGRFRWSVALVLALIPADKQEEAKKLNADQEEDFKKSMGGRGGAPPAGGRPRP